MVLHGYKYYIINTSGTQDAPENAATATTATNITATANNSTRFKTVYLTFVDVTTGTQSIETQSRFKL